MRKFSSDFKTRLNFFRINPELPASLHDCLHYWLMLVEKEVTVLFYSFLTTVSGNGIT